LQSFILSLIKNQLPRFNLYASNSSRVIWEFITTC